MAAEWHMGHPEMGALQGLDGEGRGRGMRARAGGSWGPLGEVGNCMGSCGRVLLWELSMVVVALLVRALERPLAACGGIIVGRSGGQGRSGVREVWVDLELD